MAGGLGRRVSKDERDHRFLLPPRRLEAKPIEYRMWTSPGVLDQGETSACTGFSAFKFLTSGPIINKPKPADLDPFKLYDLARKYDEWPGEDYEGSSVRGAFAALKALGYIISYHWADPNNILESTLDHLRLVSPLVVGTDWLAGMDSPDKQGVIRARGANRGGHAWLINGWSKKRGMVRGITSWGDKFAQHGRFWVPCEDLEKLLTADGEAGMAVEKKLAP